MKVLTVARMREVDRRTIELGIPGIVLMENAAHRVVEFLAEEFAPLAAQRIVVLCGKGNNGGDGLAIARQLHTRFSPSSLQVVLAAEPGSLRGDAAENLKMAKACGLAVQAEITPAMRTATLVVDALLGTGLEGPAAGRMLEMIREINSGFRLAQVVAVDIPSGLPGDSAFPSGEFVRAAATVTFTSPKLAHALPPNCDHVGKLRVAPIGSPPELIESWIELLEPRHFRHLLAPRSRGAHKGDFGHVLIAGGAAGKTGAAAMAGMAALRAGAGLVTVACAESNFTALAPELMTEPFPGVPQGKDAVAIGPGLGTTPEAVALVRRAFAEWDQPMVVDADGLNALAGQDFRAGNALRVLTPHPGEMARLTGRSGGDILQDRLGVARAFAHDRGVCLVLKGQRSLIAFPDGRVWINPTGTPAMATAGSGDILTGLIAGLLAQFPGEPDAVVAAAVYLHGLAGEIGARSRGEKCLVATDLLEFLPAAIHEALH
ncbi:MAG: NAD(P)H-hydrate dehydratase [Acidobacteria bacterium]|nr:NAD(P)H-hydrate dehydratase [Acidobacteriota bacterium]MBI3470163.1 NAD(P)H-hydrate dehydratase [Candidatus Solibacter usitatus]